MWWRYIVATDVSRRIVARMVAVDLPLARIKGIRKLLQIDPTRPAEVQRCQ